MKTTLIIQARMGSSRLPGKVLEEIAGRPMLDWAVQRGKRARLIDELIVATTICVFTKEARGKVGRA